MKKREKKEKEKRNKTPPDSSLAGKSALCETPCSLFHAKSVRIASRREAGGEEEKGEKKRKGKKGGKLQS